jgi:hypothetical protein
MAAPPILSDTDNADTHSPAHTHTGRCNFARGWVLGRWLT